MATRTQGRVNIPIKVRRDLWVAAGGRCEFRGCCKPVSRDFLTMERCNVGQFAHIIADSPGGARGEPGESERLASDPTNLMLACLDCHSRMDRNGQANEFTKEQLRAMKREHESRIDRIYSATGVVESLPVVMSFPIGAHVPVIDVRNIHYAMLTNSDFRCFPTSDHIHIDESDFHLRDHDAGFWAHAQQILTKQYEQRIEPALTSRGGAAHLTIAGFAPIPMLMKLGALIGDKTPANVLDLPGEQWLWDTRPECVAPTFAAEVPDSLPREVAVVVSITNRAVPPTRHPIVEFRAEAPDRGIIRTEAHLLQFRRDFNSFLLRITRAGARIIHIYPATPLSAGVEIGRMLLPKTFEEIHVWEWQAPEWKPALRLK